MQGTRFVLSLVLWGILYTALAIGAQPRYTVTGLGDVQPVGVAMQLYQTSFRPGQTLRLALRLSNPGPLLAVDHYVGVISPGWIRLRTMGHASGYTVRQHSQPYIGREVAR